MIKNYDHKIIEKKWQKIWEKEKPFKAEYPSPKPKFYPLIEFPYPSGEGLHTGHPRSYCALDAIARKKRMEGFNVLYPIGWDAFGLPTENYAIKMGRLPQEITKENTNTFRRQLKSLGISFDWDREINTTDPKYYKWTQWIFLQLFKHGLAYKDNIAINWCPRCKIGLANEEVIQGKCERCGTQTEKRQKEQWMLEITKYADRLLSDLDEVDYLEKIKIQQKNWIGRSKGAEVIFSITKYPKILYATNNKSKVERIKKLLKSINISTKILTPDELNIKSIEVEENGTLLENARKKALSYRNYTDLPILATDSGLFADLEEIDPLKIKRAALEGRDEKEFTQEETANKIFNYYKKIIRQHGGNIEAYWLDSWALSIDKSTTATSESKREIILTDIKDKPEDVYFPLRSIYKVKKTGKYSSEQSEDEELLELQPVTNSLKELLIEKLTVFTTRPDTIFGATFMVIAPEHPLISNMEYGIWNIDEVKDYIEQAMKKTDLERSDETKEKTGVKIEGIKAINPVNGQEIPIYVADYVMMGYGTGAIMAVPAHDRRDWEFAQKYNLPIIDVVIPKVIDQHDPPVAGKKTVYRKAVQVILINPKDQKVLCLKWKKFPWTTFITGGVEEGEDLKDAAIREVIEETGYKNIKYIKTLGSPVESHFYANHKGVNRKAHFTAFVFELVDEAQDEISIEEQEIHELSWLTWAELAADTNIKCAEYEIWLDRFFHAHYLFAGQGVLINSGNFTGLTSQEASEKISEWLLENSLGTKSVSYKLRDWVFSRQHYWGEPIPVVYCNSCFQERSKKKEVSSKLEIGRDYINIQDQKYAIVPVPEDQLPVELPVVEKYQPTETGESPLSAMTDWVNTKCPVCGSDALRETDTMPNWAGSSWYFLRYTDPTNDLALANPDKLKYWLPVNLYNGGMEHVTLHLLYSRFWHKFLFDIGVVPTKEPYQKRVSHGLILAADGQKMSKSRGNVVNPDEIVDKFGADAFRLYEMFLGPFDQVVKWQTDGIRGTYRFLEKVWRAADRIKEDKEKKADKDQESQINRLIQKINHDIDNLQFNTSVSTMMEFINFIGQEKIIVNKVWKKFLIILSLFAPHIAEELWSQIEKESLVCQQKWPTLAESKIIETKVTYAIQVNGRLRGSLIVDGQLTEQEVISLAQKLPNIIGHLSDKVIRKIIFIKNKIVNFVI